MELINNKYMQTIHRNLLLSGFHLIEMIQETFTIEKGHFEFVRMPSTFQWVMESILLDIQNERCLVYMDESVYIPRNSWTTSSSC